MTDNKVIPFKDIDVQLPIRSNFLNINNINQDIKQMKLKKPLQFLPVCLTESIVYKPYEIYLFGILPSGEKVSVVVKSILPYVEILIPPGVKTSQYVKEIKDKLVTYKIFCKTYVFRGKTIKKYNHDTEIVALMFTSLQARKEAITKYLKEYELTHDDTTCYYRVFSRDNQLSLTSWCTLNNYIWISQDDRFKTNYTIEVNYTDIVNYEGDIFADDSLFRDNTIVCCFDIETFGETGELPQPEHENSAMFKISMTFMMSHGDILMTDNHDPSSDEYVWDKPKGHLIHYDITSCITNPMPNRTVIACANMCEMVKAFAIIWSKMKPDYVVGFNCDTYDWQWIVKMAKSYGLIGMLENTMSLMTITPHKQESDIDFSNETPIVKNPNQKPDYSKSYFYWKHYTFKMAANQPDFKGAYLSYPGYICIDLLPQLRSLCSNPERYSLKYFLDYYQLGNKVDMPIQELFSIYRRNKAFMDKVGVKASTDEFVVRSMVRGRPDEQQLLEEYAVIAKDMLRVGEYCIVDSLRCHDLLRTSQFIQDKRQIGELSYVSMEDCIYRANGMKVRNMIIAKAQQRKLHISNRVPEYEENGKYPGAFVLPPDKGVASSKPSPAEMRMSSYQEFSEWRDIPEEKYFEILDIIKSKGIHVSQYEGVDISQYPKCFQQWLNTHTHYPIAGLDFSSLYPSLIMAYNLSPDMMVDNLKDALTLMKEGHEIHAIEFMLNGQHIKGWSVRSKYSTRNSDIEVILEKLKTNISIAERKQLNKEVEKIFVETEFGLFPTVLKLLFDQRVVIKKQLADIEEKLSSITADKLANNTHEYEELTLKKNYLDSKQRALKVFMNTFYGETGNQKSPLCVIALAGGVTSAGKRNLKCVEKLILDMGCRIYYGDTDSIYLSLSSEHFDEYDKEYYSLPQFDLRAKIDYWEKLVNTSFKHIVPVRNAVNKWLMEDNKTKFLSMAFEEFLYPAAFFSKKKYVGVEHKKSFTRSYYMKDSSSFIDNNPHLFVRGLEYIKKGSNLLLKELSEEILFKVMSPMNIKTLRQIVEDTLTDIYTNRTISFEKFIKTATYRPSKNNISIHTFNDRMLALGIPPTPNERFSYVIVKKDDPFLLYTVDGKKKDLSVGERMEYDHRALELGMQIDLEYYMGSSIRGQLARFISYDPEFANEDDKKAINSSKKYIKDYSAKYVQIKNKDKKLEYRTIFKDTMAEVNDTILAIFDVESMRNIGTLSVLLENVSTGESNVQTFINEESTVVAKMAITQNLNHLSIYNKNSVDRWSKSLIDISTIQRQRVEHLKPLVDKKIKSNLTLSHIEGLISLQQTIIKDIVFIKKERFLSKDKKLANAHTPITLSKYYNNLIRYLSDNRIKDIIDTVNTIASLIEMIALLKSTEETVQEIMGYIKGRLGLAVETVEFNPEDADEWLQNSY